MIDPTVRISLAVDANKGAYAVLFGSGVSAAAGIPTGWQIVTDLITRIARLEGADAGGDPVAWYQQRYGHEPDYSGLLNAIASSPTERSLLIRSYFEPTDQERLNGVKVPTIAHRTMAQLALSGHVHLFLTTNFDRLLERALEDVGIVPQVLSTPDSIGGAVPFGHTRCTVVKLNGDYMDTRIKNTPDELSIYDPAVDSLLDRVIDEYGFIVSGWSAEWDTALRGAFDRNRSQRYSMFWASRNEPRSDAAQLIERRQGEFVQIKDPDTFFAAIGDGLASLSASQTATPTPASPSAASPDAESAGLICHGCQATNIVGAKFCSACGISLGIVCSACGTEASPEARFCLNCGQQIAGDSPVVAAEETELPTGLITYLFTDVVGSTMLWQQHSQHMRNVMARHDSLMTSAVEGSGGNVVRPRGEGDSIFAVFQRASDAVTAARSAQQLLQQEQWPDGIAIIVRMAIHTGESELREHDYYGAAVNRAARLRSIAHGGQILISEATAQLVRDGLSELSSLRDMGSHRLKDMQRSEQVFQLVHPGLPADFPPLNSTDARSSNLPDQLTSFVGRHDEMDEVRGLISSGRLVTLAGAGGSGKTRLSQAIGMSLIEDYPDGVWFVGLANLSDAQMLRAQVAEVFNVGEDALDGFLSGKSTLIIIDNCEHLVAGAASLVQSLLVSTGVKVIATSREALNLAGERIFQVPPLPLPEIVTSEALMADCPSVQLFLERAEAANPAFELTTSNAASVQQIVRRLDGIPLAIELAASRVKLLQPSEIASRLEESFKLLTGGPSNVLPHHQTLERAIDWSYDNLEPDQQSLFSQLSVFRGGFTLPACGAVMGAENEFDALDALGELVDKSLVRTDSLLEETRYYMLEPLREYAADRITSEERVQVDGRHANYFLELAERASPELRGPQQVEWLEHLETEHDNIRASLAWGLAAGESDLVQRTSAALSWFWLIRRHSTEAMDWFERALAMEGGSSGSRAWLLIQSGFVGSVIYHDELDRCLAAIIEGRDQFANLGDGQGLLTAQAYEAVLMWSKRDLESSNRLFSDVQQTAEAIEFGWLIGFCDFFLGVNAWYLGKMELAVDHYNRSLDLFRSSSDTTMTAWLLSRMANVSLGSKDLAGATTVLEECMSLMEQVGDRHGIGAAFLGLGISAHLSGDADEAQSLLGEAQTHLREGGGGQGLSWPLSNVYINTSTHEAIFEVTERYQASLSLPTDEWAKMVIDDAESLDKLNRPN